MHGSVSVNQRTKNDAVSSLIFHALLSLYALFCSYAQKLLTILLQRRLKPIRIKKITNMKSPGEFDVLILAKQLVGYVLSCLLRKIPYSSNLF